MPWQWTRGPQQQFPLQLRADLGHRDTFGPSMLIASIVGSHRARDHVIVVFFADWESNTGSTLNVDVQLGAGNDNF
jgi:hypothetical protein